MLTYPSGATEDPKVRKILKAHIDALGGWKNWNEIQSIRQTGTIERDGKTIHFCIIKKRPNKIRATVTVPTPGKENESVQLIRAHDGHTAWTAIRHPGEQMIRKTDLFGIEEKELLADASVLPKLVQLWDAGATIKIMEYPNNLNQHTTTIQATQTEMSDVYIFKLNRRYLTTDYSHQNENGSTTRTHLSHYKNVNGVTLPMRTLIESKETGTSKMVTDTVILGVGIYPDYFEANNQSKTVVVTVK